MKEGNTWCWLFKLSLNLDIFEHFSSYCTKQLYFRHGMHEPYENYFFCMSTSRNKGLFTADQVCFFHESMLHSKSFKIFLWFSFTSNQGKFKVGVKRI